MGSRVLRLAGRTAHSRLQAGAARKRWLERPAGGILARRPRDPIQALGSVRAAGRRIEENAGGDAHGLRVKEMRERRCGSSDAKPSTRRARGCGRTGVNATVALLVPQLLRLLMPLLAAAAVVAMAHVARLGGKRLITALEWQCVRADWGVAAGEVSGCPLSTAERFFPAQTGVRPPVPALAPCAGCQVEALPKPSLPRIEGGPDVARHAPVPVAPDVAPAERPASRRSHRSQHNTGCAAGPVGALEEASDAPGDGPCGVPLAAAAIPFLSAEAAAASGGGC